MSIRRFVELILDKNAAKRVEKDTKQSLDKGTDPKKAEKNLGRVGGAMEKLRGLAKKLAVAFGVAFAARKIQQFGKESIRVALEAESVWNRLEGQLAAVGVRYEDVRGEIDRTARAMQDATTVGDEDFAAILTELVGISGDYSASLREVQTVADLAAAKQLDFRTAAQLVGRVMVGETGTLSRYGIIVEEGADAMEVLRARFAGMAENEGRDFEGWLKRVNNEWGDFQQAIGDAMIEAGGGTSVLETLTGTLKGATEWVNQNRMAIAGWGRLIIRTVGAAYQSVRFVIRSLFNLGQVIGSTIELGMLELQRQLAPTLNRIADFLDKIPGVSIPIRMNELTPEQFAAEQKRLTDQIKRDTNDLKDTVFDLGEAYRAVGRAAVDAAVGQAQSARAGRESPTVATPSGGGGGVPEVERRDMNDQLVSSIQPDSFIGQVRYMRKEIDRVGVFDGLIEQADLTAAYMQEGFQGVGRAIVAQLTEGRAQEQFAAGLAALAAGTWPPNPAALAAAGKHFAAAAAFKALGAQFGGSSGMAGFGAGGAMGGPPGAIGTSRPGPQPPTSSELNIYIDPLSPDDTRVQRVVLGAAQAAQERFGDKFRVNIRARTGG